MAGLPDLSFHRCREHPRCEAADLDFLLIGGVFLYNIVKWLVSSDAAVFATGYYLLAPMSILLSRSFQADALMMLCFVMSLFAIVRYYSMLPLRIAIAVALSAFTILYRCLVLFG